MKRTFFALCAGLIILSFPARAASFWEGTAVASSYGEFPSAGLYAACSSFPRNTVVEVTNLENGKSVQVLVTRSLDNPGVFIALSPEAASQLLIQIGMVARVKVSLPQSGADNVLRSDSPGMSQDPDLNPQALVARERQKEDSGLAALSPAEEKIERPVEPQGEKVAVAATPKATPAPGVSRPDAIGSQRPSPSEKALAVRPRDLPETPLSEKTPSAVKAKTETYVPDAQAMQKPEALSRESVGKGRGEKASYAMSSPELEADKANASVSSEVPAKAQVYEKTSLSRPEGASLAGVLSDPELESRGTPESALTRMKAPEADSRLAASMAAPELEGIDAQEGVAQDGALQKAEAYEITRKSGLRSDETGVASLDLPDVQDSGSGGVTAEERLVVIRKATPQTDLSSLALADPSLGEEQAAIEEKPDDGVLLSADERLVAGRRVADESQVALMVDPEMQELPEAEALPTAEERLLASRRIPDQGEAVALADPEMGEAPVDENALASVDEKPKAARKQGEAVSFSIPDPEMTDVSLAAADENAPPEALSKLGKPKGKEAAKTQIALARPELAPEEKAIRPEVSAETRPEPEGARDILAFDKMSPELAMEERAETEKPETAKVESPKVETPKVEKPKVETTKPEIVESYRKGAEALVALNARKMDNLSKGIYYVQVGVYRSGQGAAQAVKGLTPDYPLAFQEVAAREDLFYKVYIGPLKKDESGIVLYRLKSMGFKDAFVRKGD